MKRWIKTKDKITCDDGVWYDKAEIKLMKKLKDDIEAKQQIHSIKKIFDGELCWIKSVLGR